MLARWTFQRSWIYRFLRATAENYRLVRHNVCIMSWEVLGRRSAIGVPRWV